MQTDARSNWSLVNMCRGILLFICLGLFSATTLAAPPHSGVTGVMACLNMGCDVESGPVCAVDDSGLTRTFENRCMADIAYCRFGIYYAVVKPGEC